MSIFSTRPALRWAVPGIAAVGLVGGSAIVGGLASADSGLPSRSAAQLLADVEQARLDGLSGTIVQRSDLGLPSLPGIGSSGSGSSDLTSLVSGTHTMRLWYAGPDQARLALLGTLGESDIIQNGTDVWTWSSQDNAATHRTLTKGADKHATASPRATDLPKTPQAAADAALKAIDPTTLVSTSGTATVAGRPAYELLLRPRDAGSLVAQVRIAIDGVKHVPLRVEVFAKGAAAPAFEVAFTAVDFTRPDAAQFRFNPPPGAKVTQSGTAKPGDATQPRDLPPAAGKSQPKVVGSGWTSVVVATMPPSGLTGATGTTGAGGTDRQAAQLDRMLQALPHVSGAWGSGRLLSGTLFSVLLTDDGRVVAGAVSPDRLYAALAAR